MCYSDEVEIDKLWLFVHTFRDFPNVTVIY